MQKLSPEAEKLENLKMWLTEQIERYELLAKRCTGSDQIQFGGIAQGFRQTLARLTEDEK